MQRTGFIDWTEGNLNFHIFDEHKHVDSTSVPVEGELNPASLTSLLKTSAGEIYLSVPSSLLTFRELTFPFSDKIKIRDTIAFELEDLLLGSVNDYSIDHIVTEYLDSGCRVLAVCIEKTRLREIINTFSSAGLEPKIITSVDLRLSGGNSERLIEGLTHDNEARTKAAGEEIENPTVNLRRDELAYTGDLERMKKSLRLSASLLLVLLLILGAFMTLKFVSGKKENKRLNTELADTFQSVFPEDKKIIDAVRQFKGNLNMLREKKAVLGGVPVLDMLNNVAKLKSRNIVLNDFNADGKNLIIKGTAATFEEVDAFKNNLASAFDGVKVLNSDATADKKINFTIIMQEKTV